MTKIELTRSIIPQLRNSVKINLTVKVGESYLLLDSIDVIDVKSIRTDAMIHQIDMIGR